MQLSQNFSLYEFTRSATATRLGIDNTPSPIHIRNLSLLCVNFLEPVRMYFGSPIMVSSGYRCSKLNSLIGGAQSSQHMTGQAVDWEIPGYSNREVADWCAREMVYDQIILEFFDPRDPNSGWIHTSYVDPNIQSNRKQYLYSYRTPDRKVHYSPMT